MADVFRQMQKSLCHDGRPNGGRRFPYGCPCCRKHPDRNKHKKWARRQARVLLKRLPDELIGTRR